MAPWRCCFPGSSMLSLDWARVGLFLTQLAFRAGPLTASLPAISTVDPLLSVTIGVVVYDEHLRRGPLGGALLAALLLLLVTAVVGLGRVELAEDKHTT